MSGQFGQVRPLFLAAGQNLSCAVERLARDPAVLLRQEIHREMDAVHVAAGNRQIARGFRAAGQGQRVELVQQFTRIDRGDSAFLRAAADMHAIAEGDALGRHL